VKSLIFLVLSSLTMIGCQKGDTGAAGPVGPQGGNTTAYSATFESGIYPDIGYAGSQCNWVDGSTPNTAPGTGEIRVGTGTTTANVQLGLIRFDLSYSIPINATITACSLQLATKTTSTLSSGTYFLGVHQIIVPPAGNILWNATATWNVAYTGMGWNGGVSSAITAGVEYNSSPLDSVSLTSAQINGNQVLVGWNIPASLAQVWVNPANANFGLLISTEPEISASLSGYASFWDNNGSSQQKPKLTVNYTIP
jgi:hypothetical protein